MPKKAPAPYESIDHELFRLEVHALRALQAGEASKEQQQLALKFIVETISGTYDWAFRPGAEGDRETLISLGRQFVGNQIVRLLKVKLSAKPTAQGV